MTRIIRAIGAAAVLLSVATDGSPLVAQNPDADPQPKPRRASFDDDNEATAKEDHSPWTPSEYARWSIDEKLREGDPVAAFERMCDWRLDPRLTVAMLTAKCDKREELNRSVADAYGDIAPDAIERMLERVHRTIATARQAADPLRVFRERIESDPNNAPWYRLAYLAFVRSLPEAPLDFELAAPLLNDNGHEARSYRRCIDLLLTLQRRNRSFDDPATQQVCRRLEAIVQQPTFVPDPVGVEWAKRNQPLLVLYQRCPPERIRELDGIARGLADKLNGEVFFRMAQQSGVAAHTLCDWQLDRVLSVDCQQQPLDIVLRDLFAKAPTPYWLDSTIAGSKALVTLNRKASVRELLNQVLADTPFAVQPAAMNVQWIGPPERRPAFDELIAKIDVRLPKVGRVRDALQRPVIVSGKEDYLSIVTHELAQQAKTTILRTTDGIDIVNVGAKADTPIRTLPLAFALADLAERNNLEWIASEWSTAIDSKEGVKRYQELFEQHAVRMADLRALENQNPAIRALDRLISFDFTETPLTDVTEYLKDYSTVNLVLDKKSFEVAQVEVDTPITLDLEQVPFSLALSLIYTPLGLDWAVIEDNLILIATAE